MAYTDETAGKLVGPAWVVALVKSPAVRRGLAGTSQVLVIARRAPDRPGHRPPAPAGPRQPRPPRPRRPRLPLPPAQRGPPSGTPPPRTSSPATPNERPGTPPTASGPRPPRSPPPRSRTPAKKAAADFGKSTADQAGERAGAAPRAAAPHPAPYKCRTRSPGGSRCGRRSLRRRLVPWGAGAGAGGARSRRRPSLVLLQSNLPLSPRLPSMPVSQPYYPRKSN